MVGNIVGVGGPTIRSGCLPITVRTGDGRNEGEIWTLGQGEKWGREVVQKMGEMRKRYGHKAKEKNEGGK
jgi:hypothetical protein